MKDNRCRPGEKYIFSSPDGAFRAIATKMSDACQGHTSISVEIFSQIRSFEGDYARQTDRHTHRE